MAGAIGSVIIASAQSVAKVFIIGSIGYLSVIYPKGAPFLPRNLVGNIARFTFHALTIPLIYSTIAIAVTIESVGNYWFVIVGAFAVMSTSYVIATLTQCMVLRKGASSSAVQDFRALRIAVTFPNIVALPILIFPSLCEFPIVYENYVVGAPEDADAAFLERQCVAQSTTMIFCYFFSWSLVFWSFGNRQLLQAAAQRHKDQETPATIESQENNNCCDTPSGSAVDDIEECGRSEISANLDTRTSPKLNDAANTENNGLNNHSSSEQQYSDLERRTNLQSSSQQAITPAQDQRMSIWQSIWIAVKQTTTSSGFIAMAAGFLTACIPPLQKALFEGGGPLRFLGSAVETLGVASSPISTMVVAASLVPPTLVSQNQEDEDTNTPSEDICAVQENQSDIQPPVIDENPAMTDPNFGPYRRRPQRSSRLKEIGRSIRRSSVRVLHAVPRSTPEMMRLHVWFCLSRLVLTPATIVGLILALDCGLGLGGVPNMAKLVIVVNAALPGALIVIVLLKSKEEMSETAACVAKVYMPSYILSILTIAAWTAVGLWITIPDDNGNSVCNR